jgi:hypothetical protein
MRDPRLQHELFQARQPGLIKQAAGDRLAVSRRAERRALGDVLAAVGRALLALSVRLGGEPALSPVSAETAPRHGCGAQQNGHTEEWAEAARHVEGAAAVTSTLVALRSRPTASNACS